LPTTKGISHELRELRENNKDKHISQKKQQQETLGRQSNKEERLLWLGLFLRFFYLFLLVLLASLVILVISVVVFVRFGQSPAKVRLPCPRAI